MCFQSGFETVQGRCSSECVNGSEFRAAGPACEQDHSPKFVSIRGEDQFLVLAERCFCTATVLISLLR